MNKIFVAGHRGMVGSSIIRQLLKQGVSEDDIIVRTREELDLLNQNSVNEFFAAQDISQVYLAAAKVGGIYANNTYPAEFIYQNLMIEVNIINAAFVNGVKKLLFLGSSCIYPKVAKQPMGEDSLLTGILEPTNESYAIAKIAGIKLCESYNRQYGEEFGVDYRSVMPTNLYGPGDNYHPENSHVIPALLRRFHEAKINNKSEVYVWGSGEPRREFLYVDDMANACVYVMNLDKKTYSKHTKPMQSHLNVGCGEDIRIRDLAEMIKEITGYSGEIVFDNTKPDGPMKKLIDSSRLNKLGWHSKTKLHDGLEKTYKAFLREIG